jgi:hypothetical protein
MGIEKGETWNQVPLIMVFSSMLISLSLDVREQTSFENEDFFNLIDIPKSGSSILLFLSHKLDNHSQIKKYTVA